MIIGTCGFCSTGSSAVSDYLKEFEDNQVLDNAEFVFVYLPDGILDLRYHLCERICRDDSSNLAILRFKKFMNANKKSYCKKSMMTYEKYDFFTNSFLNAITDLRWYGSRRSDNLFYNSKFYDFFGISIMKQRIIPYLNKKTHKCVNLYPYHEISVSISPQNFDVEAKKLINNLLSGLGADLNKNIILDQPFPGDDPKQCFNYFDNPKAIVVDRDPRDNYIFAKEFLYRKGKYMPIDSVEDFVAYYKLLRDNRPFKNFDADILRIRFEDMVYNYDNTTKQIRRFCNLPENKNKFSVFDPKLSIANTQLILRFPKYAEDVEYIERNLQEYLFDFENYPLPKINGSMFMGKSPLNKK